MLSLTLGRRLASRLRARAAVVPAVVVIAFAFAVNVFLDEQTLTGEQEADRLPGRFEASISRLGISIPAGSTSPEQLQSRLESAGIPVVVSLQAPDLSLPELADDGIYYREMPWEPQPFPDALDLVEGRFPTGAGEVALVGSGISDRLAVGERISVLGQADAFTVVGVVENTLSDDEQVLAAPGTWATLDPSSDTTLSQATASPTFFISDPEPLRVVAPLADTVSDVGLVDGPGGSSSALESDFASALRTRADARADTEPAWTARSPLTFWVPVATLTPLAILLAFWGMLRRVGPALRNLKRQGVTVSSAVGAGAVGVLAWVIPAVGASALLGSLAGHAVAQAGAGRWSSPGATWRFPSAAVLATSSGVVAGALAGTALLWAVTRDPRPRARGSRRSLLTPRLMRNLRHGCAAVAGAVAVYFAMTLRTPNDGMRLSAVVAVVAALATPDLLDGIVSRLPSDSLTRRLTARLMSAYSRRNGLTTATLVVAVACSCGLLVSVTSAVEAERALRGATALPGQVALDNDDTPALPVPAAVVRAAERVPALRDQEPVQVRVLGELRERTNPDIIELTNTVSPANTFANTFAFDSTSDVERVVGRTLSARETAVLDNGGVLVIDPELPIASGTVDLVDAEGSAAGTYEAARAEIRPTPWFVAVPTIMLTSTAEAEGLPTSDGALIYTGVSPEDSQQVLQALSRAGINPETAEVHRDLPPVVPPAALTASALALFVLLFLLAIASTHSQVVSMRPWASRLTQLGVRLRWAQGVVIRQYGVMLAVAVPVGVLAGVAPLVLTRWFVPEITIVVPWVQIAALLLALIAAVGVACWFSSRAISARLALGWQDFGE
ncbi:hypothetical protein [Nocardioides lacusdianchii]|uniref:hypothetical protein n=1 Tax=Nocardioides lacusdianchii TaxID=2783664 RepID=UPI001CCBD574|nr:hypothetical protein [Nocardioides lacusdianchii]